MSLLTNPLNDTFLRSTSPGLGVSDSGHTWDTNVLLSTRTNLITNPSFETNTTGWAPVAGTFARSTAQFNVGTASGQLTGASHPTAPPRIQMTVNTTVASVPYVAQCKIKLNTGVASRDMRIDLRFWSGPNNTGTQLLLSTGSAVTCNDSSWTQVNSLVATAPVGTQSIQVQISATALATTESWFIDAIQLEQASSAGTYFDGSSTGGAWTGTAHASTSTLGVFGPNPNMSVDGSTGVVSVPALNTAYDATVTGESEADVDLVQKFYINTAPVGDSLHLDMKIRDNGTTYTMARVSINPDGTTSLYIHNSGSSSSATAGDSWTGHTQVNVHARMVGSSAKLKVWFGEQVEPTNWDLIKTVTSTNATGTVGFQVTLGSSSTNTLPYVVLVDDAVYSAAEPLATILDTYTRSVAAGSLGVSDSDHTYVITGTSSKLSVDGSKAVASLTNDGETILALIERPLTDVHAFFDVSVPSTTTDDTSLGFIRYVDANNWLLWQITFASAGTASLNIRKKLSGVETSVATFALGSYTGGEYWTLKAEAVGTYVRGKAWKTAGTEPVSWQISQQDASLPGEGDPGYRIARGTTGTAGPHLVHFDNLSVRNAVPGISVELVDSLDSPGIRITITNGDVYPSVRVERIHVDNRILPTAVRGLDDVTIPSEITSVIDYEIPLDENFVYKIVTLDENSVEISSAESEPAIVEVPYHRVILRSVGQPTLSRRIMISQFPGFQRDLRVLQEARVLGRSNPVVLFDVLEGMTGDFECLPMLDSNDPTGADLKNLLSEGQPLLFQSVSRLTGIDDFYLVVKSVKAVPKTKVHPTEPVRYTFSIAFMQIDRPPTDSESLGFFTWQTIPDVGHLSWQSVDDTFTSWLSVLNFAGRDPL